MMTPTLMAFAPFPTTLPMTRHINPGHDIRDESAALDLCTKKRPLSPNFPYDYKNPQHFTFAPSISPKTEVSDVSSSEDKDYNANITNMLAKRSRPFKVYPKNPISVAIMGSSLDNIFGEESTAAYAEFREKMLAQAQSLNHNGTNKNMRRTQSTSPQMTDPAYREKRQKNNEAAKRSRDARRAKEDEIAIRCAFLEQENLRLKCRLATLEKETERLHNILYK